MTGCRAADEATGLADLFRLRVQLQDVNPTAWRRVVIPAAVRPDHLYRVVQTAMG